MSSYISTNNSNKNLTELFMSRQTTAGSSTYLYQDGIDLSQLFQQRYGTQSNVLETGFKVNNNNTDLNQVFMDINAQQNMSVSGITPQTTVYNNQVYEYIVLAGGVASTRSNPYPNPISNTCTVIPLFPNVQVNFVLIGGGAGGGAAQTSSGNNNGGAAGGAGGGYCSGYFTSLVNTTYYVYGGGAGTGGYYGGGQGGGQASAGSPGGSSVISIGPYLSPFTESISALGGANTDSAGNFNGAQSDSNYYCSRTTPGYSLSYQFIYTQTATFNIGYGGTGCTQTGNANNSAVGENSGYTNPITVLNTTFYYGGGGGGAANWQSPGGSDSPAAGGLPGAGFGGYNSGGGQDATVSHIIVFPDGTTGTQYYYGCGGGGSAWGQILGSGGNGGNGGNGSPGVAILWWLKYQ